MMRLTIDRETLTRALARVQGVLTRKGSMTILANVMLEASAGGLTVSATDLDITYQGHVRCKTATPGRITVDGKRLYDVVRSMPGESIAIECIDGRMTLTAGGAELVLFTVESDTYPTLPVVDEKRLAHVDGTLLRELIERVAFSAGSDESRPNLNGVFLLVLDDGAAVAVSTDGHRLSRGKREKVTGEKLKPNDGVIIPRKGVGELRKFLDEFADVSIDITEGLCIVETDGLSLSVRLIDAQYPDYEQVLPKHTDWCATIRRLPLLAALQRICILASEKTHGVRIELRRGVATLTSDNPDLGHARECVDIEGYDQGALTIALNARYVQDVLRVLAADKVEVRGGEVLSPVLITEEQSADYRYVIMPMRI